MWEKCLNIASLSWQLSPALMIANVLQRQCVCIFILCVYGFTDVGYRCKPLIAQAEKPGASARNLSKHFIGGVSGVCTALVQSSLSCTRKLWFGTCVVAVTRELKGWRTKGERSCSVSERNLCFPTKSCSLTHSSVSLA